MGGAVGFRSLLPQAGEGLGMRGVEVGILVFWVFFCCREAWWVWGENHPHPGPPIEKEGMFSVS